MAIIGRNPKQLGRGFSLLEALIAAAIGAMAVTQFYQALATGALLDQKVDRQSGLIAAGMAALDRIETGGPNEARLVPGATWRGTYGSFDWTASARDAVQTTGLDWLQVGSLLVIDINVVDRENADVHYAFQTYRLNQASW